MLHGFSIVNDGVNIGTLTESEIVAQRTDLAINAGLAERTYPVTAERELAGPFIFAVGGAPLMIRRSHEEPVDPLATYTPKIFTDGPDLTQPAICWGRAYRPDDITITNEDPKTWEPPESAIIYGVADLVGFPDLTDGWPTNTWPIGDILI